MDSSHKIYTIATLTNTVLLLCCAGYLFFNGAPSRTQPATVATVSVVEEVDPVAEPPKQISRGPRKKIDGIEGLFLDIMEPVKRAALDHQADPALYLPSEDELSKAIGSNSLDSKESMVVLEKLKKGYAEYNMPFPSLSAPPPPSNPTQQTVSLGDPKEIEAWIKPTIQRLKDEFKARESGDVSSFLPSEDDIKQAIDSGSFEAPAFVRVREKIERGYQELQVPFPTPGQPQTAPNQPPEPVSQGGSQETVAEQQIINAYFQGQMQRIKLESKKQDKDISDCFPSSQDMKTAVQTGSISSEESLSVIASLEGCYQSLDIPFHPPVRK